MKLRPYQRAAVDVLWDYLANNAGNPAIVLPTGAGKSPLMAAIAREAHEQWQSRVGIIAHTKELVAQNHDKLRQYWPEARAGIYSASLRRRDRFEPILFMQIQSVHSRAHELGRFDLLLVDEAHRIPTKAEGTYRSFIAECKRFNPRLPVVGLTATPYRLQGRAVPVCGPDYILNEIIYEARIPDLIEQDYLSRLISKPGETPDLSNVHLRGGEYIETELSAVMSNPALVHRTVADLLGRASGRKAGIVFCVDVAHAEAVLSELHAHGEAAELIHGGTSASARDAAVYKFQSGALRWLVNINVLSEGFDAPHVDIVVMLRPTKSPGLYYQQVGRGLRIAAGKTDCLVLDYAGNTLEHGAIDEIRVQKPRKVGAIAKVVTGTTKQCPRCEALLSVGIRTCPECGHTFGGGDPAHLDRPIDAPVLSTERERLVNTHEVHSVKYDRHDKPGKPISLRATYLCGPRRFSEWVCLEHGGLARSKAYAWWQRRSSLPVPRTVDEALADAYRLPRPMRIVVDETNKYPEILNHEFDEAELERTRAAHSCRSADAASAGSTTDKDSVHGMRGIPSWLVRAVESKRAA